METNVIAAAETAQPIALEDIKRKTHFSGVVKKITLAGAIVDIGLAVPGVVHISQLQEGPTNRVEDVVHVGQTVDVWVRRVDPKKKRIELTMIKPLDLEWREITPGMVVKGKVSRLEKFGAFVEIGAERPGLVHISEMTHGYIKSPADLVKEGDEVEVQVLAVNRRKKQIKLSMKALEEIPQPVEKPAKPAAHQETVKEPPAQPQVEEDPTAMAMALREAMERSNVKLEGLIRSSKRRKKSNSNQLEHIYERTLQNKRK
jgi:ribosomal protein S1